MRPRPNIGVCRAGLVVAVHLEDVELGMGPDVDEGQAHAGAFVGLAVAGHVASKTST